MTVIEVHQIWFSIATCSRHRRVTITVFLLLYNMLLKDLAL